MRFICNLNLLSLLFSGTPLPSPWASSHVPVALVRPLVIVVVKSLIEVLLQSLYRLIEPLSKRFPEELVQRPYETVRVLGACLKTSYL